MQEKECQITERDKFLWSQEYLKNGPFPTDIIVLSTLTAHTRQKINKELSNAI